MYLIRSCTGGGGGGLHMTVCGICDCRCSHLMDFELEPPPPTPQASWIIHEQDTA